MEHQALFSLKNNEKIFMMSSAAVVIGALRVNGYNKISVKFHYLMCICRVISNKII